MIDKIVVKNLHLNKQRFLKKNQKIKMMDQVENQVSTINLRPNTCTSPRSTNRFAIFTEYINRKINIENEESNSSNTSSSEGDSPDEFGGFVEGKKDTKNRLWSDIMEGQDVFTNKDDESGGWILKTKKMGKKSKMFWEKFNEECFQKQHEKKFDDQEKELDYMVKCNSIPCLEDYSDYDEQDGELGVGKVCKGYESCEEKQKVTYIGRDWY
jgi:hypothetical protein